MGSRGSLGRGQHRFPTVPKGLRMSSARLSTSRCSSLTPRRPKGNTCRIAAAHSHGGGGPPRLEHLAREGSRHSKQEEVSLVPTDAKTFTGLARPPGNLGPHRGEWVSPARVSVRTVLKAYFKKNDPFVKSMVATGLSKKCVLRPWPFPLFLPSLSAWSRPA